MPSYLLQNNAYTKQFFQKPRLDPTRSPGSMTPTEIIEIEDSDDECIVKEPLTPGNILSESDLESEDDENEPEQKPLIFPSTDIKVSISRRVDNSPFDFSQGRL